MSPTLNILSLTKVYPNTSIAAVDNIDLQINKGEFFGLLGPNGAGKTTTISMLSSLLKPTSGNISIGCLEITENVEKVRKLIGVVPQDIALFPQLTATENLKFFGRMYGMRSSILNNRINELLNIFGLKQKKNQLVETYSGGMKRRLNLIAGILHTPDILFLDEPTVGIDVQSRNVIMDYLTALKNNGMTLVYTSHHMEEAEKFCSSIAIIDMGKIICRGHPKKLINEHTHCSSLEDIFLEKTGKRLRD